MLIYEELEQGTEEWLRVRGGKITGSEVMPLISLVRGTGRGGHLNYCRKKAVEKLCGIEKATFKSPAMEQGTEREPFARMAYELLKGVSVRQVGFVELNEFVGCSPDGLVGEDGAIEIKSKTDDGHAKLILGEDDFESQYIWQAYYVMYVCDRRWVDLISYNPHFGKSSIFIKHIERNEDMDSVVKKALELGVNEIKEYINKLNKLITND